jgi:hypothetical protein
MAVMKSQVYEHLERGAGEALEESNQLMAESFGRRTESRPPTGDQSSVRSKS